MTAKITIEKATADDSHEITVMVGELLSEIMNTIGVQAFNFDLEETTNRLKDFFNRDKYFVFVARENGRNSFGFIALYESYALYAEGSFGTMPELYVRPEFRSNHVGLRRAGDALAEVVDTAHNGRNAGSTPVKLFVFYTGTVDGKLSAKVDTE